ncbi:MAG: MBOAT family protein [Firmicutes bacterium]|nr:MBOAT family protein [Bacillota bacterium]
MVFSSLAFLGVFLPLFLAAYYLTCRFARPYRNTVVFLFSVGFYGYGTFVSGTPLYLIVILASVVFNYYVGMVIYKCGVSKKDRTSTKRFVLIIGLVVDFGVLFVFKYIDFILGTSLGLVLPIGISFYTFQIVSYIIDVYRDPSLVEKSFVNIGAYIMMFPQLIAGPIVRFSDVRTEIHQRKESLQKFLDGLKTFVIGLGFKVILANQLGSIWTAANTIGYSSISVPMAWVSMAGYTFQLYFDFCGYSLMAIGLGRMMGFEFPQNFNSPYVSVSMTEFWRRWHMTLGSWFREYVYIPLGGNRRGMVRTIFNLFVVWMLTGIWHGADWNFVIWGLFLFLIMTVERFGLKDVLDKHRRAGRIYMLLLIPLQWMVFAISDLGQLKIFYGRLIGIGGENVVGTDWLMQLKDFWWIFILAVFFSTEIPGKLYKKYKNNPVVYVLLAGVLGVAVYCLLMGLDDPFMYFRF